MVSALISRCLILSLGTLYPAYRSYKAIKNKDVREYVKWMMYWIVFALFTAIETFLDIFMSWFPFYYEIKILFILWVLSPATRGSSLLYKKMVHPLLNAREKEIDDFIEKTKQQGYTTFLNLFSSGFQYASTLFINSAIKGQWLLENQLKKSFSTSDVSNSDINILHGGGGGIGGSGAASGPNNNVVLLRKNNQMIIEEDNDWVLGELDEDLDNRIDEDQQYLINKHSSNTLTRASSLKQDDDLNTDKPTKRRQSNRRAAAAAATGVQQNQNTKQGNYKSTEASHYGTISRSKKVTKTKSKQPTNLDTNLTNSQIQQTNEEN